MDSVYIKVSQEPSSLSSKEMVVTRLNFLNELKLCKSQKPATDLITLNYIRNLAEEIGSRHDKNFNVYKNVIPSDYVGIRCVTDEELAKVIECMFLATYPQILDKYVENQLRKRPIFIRVVYAVGDLGSYDAFDRLKIPEISEKQLDSHLGDAKVKKEESEVVEEKQEQSLETEDDSSGLKKFFKLKK